MKKEEWSLKKTVGFLIIVFILTVSFTWFIQVKAIDDENIKLIVYPETSYGGYIYINFTSKKYEGNIDVLFGFNETVNKPKSFEYYDPKLVKCETILRIPDIYFDDPNYKYNYTSEYVDKDKKICYNGTIYLWSMNITWCLDYEHWFDVADMNNRIIKYYEYQYKEWFEVEKTSFKKLTINFKGYGLWYYKTFNIKKNVEYYCRINVDVLPTLTNKLVKYWVAIKPSNEGLKESIRKNHFYFIDPWLNTTWSFRKAHNITGSSVSDVYNYPVNITVHYGIGNDSKSDVYLHGLCKKDFGDIRITDEYCDNLLSYYNETIVEGNYAHFWIKIPLISKNENTTIYIYFGNPNVNSISDGDDTFDFFDHFEGNSLNLTKWSEIYDQGSYLVNNSILYMIAPNNMSHESIASDIVFNTNHSIRFRGKFDDDMPNFLYSRSESGFFKSRLIYQNAEANILRVFGSSEFTREIAGNDTHSQADTLAFTKGSYSIFEINRYLNNVTRFYENSSLITTIYYDGTNRWIVLYCRYSGELWIDWLFIRNYVYPEPKHGGWGYFEMRQISVPLGGGIGFVVASLVLIPPIIILITMYRRKK